MDEDADTNTGARIVDEVVEVLVGEVVGDFVVDVVVGGEESVLILHPRAGVAK